MFLNSHTFHSLRYGTLSVEELVKQAVDSGAKSLVLTDINTVTSIYDFKKECEKVGIKPIVGMEIRKENELLYITIAKDETGIAEINRLLTNYNCDGVELPQVSPDFQKVFVIYPLENIPEVLKENEFIGVRAEE
ncbi:MAG: PHP domain-containing protein, partial [Flavobacteriales bacterium]|nr:PHP domain-containing protein [Flavobacteriales bacterium]